jgi:hypothetical protein
MLLRLGNASRPSPQPFPTVAPSQNVLLAVEAAEPVPWTKPEDIPYQPEKPLPPIGGLFADITQAVFLEASVVALRKDVDEKVLKALIGGPCREPYKRMELEEPSESLHARLAEARRVNPPVPAEEPADTARPAPGRNP